MGGTYPGPFAEKEESLKEPFEKDRNPEESIRKAVKKG